jgi:hypothetical protein
MRHGKYWELVDEQEVDSGYRTKEDAEKQVQSLSLPYKSKVRVELLKTLEHDLPSDDPDFDPSQRFPSERWCITYRG